MTFLSWFVGLQNQSLKEFLSLLPRVTHSTDSSVMNHVSAILKEFPFMILDGALASELEARGCDLNDSLWSARVLVEQPQLIKQVHTDYFASGADCVITSSYQASFEGFAARGIGEDDTLSLLRRSVALAVEARDEFWIDEKARTGRPKPIVAASIGPYGAILHDGSEYRGDYKLNVEELKNFHRKRMSVLADAGADMVAVETIPSFKEAEAIASLLSEFPGIRAWLSFTAKDGSHISDGTHFDACVDLVQRTDQIIAFGVNCTAPQYCDSLIRIAVDSNRDFERAKPFLVYPNSGEVYRSVDNTWSGESSSGRFAEQAREWFRAGARIIGGCCRTGPQHVRALAQFRRELMNLKTSTGNSE
jgi:homocysteine S-methyltransferase